LVSSRTSKTTSTSTINPLYDKIENIASELSSSYTKNLLYAAGDNAPTIIDYITIMKTEVNNSNHYGNDTVRLLCRFSKYHKNKPFKEVARNDIISRIFSG
jgi:hypothetical protein